MPNSSMLTNYRTCLSTEIDQKKIIPPSFILCTDTGDVYYDIFQGERVRIKQQIKFAKSEEERKAIEDPEEETFYLVLSSCRIYIYTGIKWRCLSGAYTRYKFNIEVPGNDTLELNNDFEYLDKDIANVLEFIPYPEFLDICSRVHEPFTCSLTDENKITIQNALKYDITGILSVTY